VPFFSWGWSAVGSLCGGDIRHPKLCRSGGGPQLSKGARGLQNLGCGRGQTMALSTETHTTYCCGAMEFSVVDGCGLGGGGGEDHRLSIAMP
jgi:hypothetical protein